MAFFNSFERRMLVDGSWQLVSMRTSAKDIIFNDDKNLEDKMGGLSFVSLSQADYNALANKDSSTIYITYE